MASEEDAAMDDSSAIEDDAGREAEEMAAGQRQAFTTFLSTHLP